MRWHRRREPGEPSEADYQKVDRMLEPGGDWALAVLQVTAVDRPPDAGARYMSARVTGVLRHDMRPAEAVEAALMMMPTAKWLRAGDEVAVLVRLSKLAAGRPGAVNVIWERLPERATLDARSAQAQAAWLRGEPADPDQDLYRAGVVGDPDRPLPGSPGGGTTVQQADALIHAGAEATAVVLAAVDVPVPRLLRATVPAGGPPVDLTLEVTRPDGTTHRVRTRVGFSTPERRARVARVGAVLPVRLDDDPNKIAIDTVALGFT